VNTLNNRRPYDHFIQILVHNNFHRFFDRLSELTVIFIIKNQKGGIMIDSSTLLYIIIVAIFIIVFLIMRDVLCWYFKISSIVKILKSIEALIRNERRVQ